MTVKKEKIFTIFSYVHEDFIAAISLLNDLIKILIGLDIFNCIIFKDLVSDCYCKNSMFQ